MFNSKCWIICVFVPMVNSYNNWSCTPPTSNLVLSKEDLTQARKSSENERPSKENVIDLPLDATPCVTRSKIQSRRAVDVYPSAIEECRHITGSTILGQFLCRIKRQNPTSETRSGMTHFVNSDRFHVPTALSNTYRHRQCRLDRRVSLQHKSRSMGGKPRSIANNPGIVADDTRSVADKTRPVADGAWFLADDTCSKADDARSLADGIHWVAHG